MEKVHSDYLTKPFWELSIIYGHEWLNKQAALFKKILEDDSE